MHAETHVTLTKEDYKKMKLKEPRIEEIGKAAARRHALPQHIFGEDYQEMKLKEPGIQKPKRLNFRQQTKYTKPYSDLLQE